MMLYFMYRSNMWQLQETLKYWSWSDNKNLTTFNNWYSSITLYIVLWDGGGGLITCNVNLFAAVLIIRCQWRHFDTIWDQIFSKFMYSFFIYIHLIFRLMQLIKLENGRLPVFSISQYMYNIIVIKLYSIKCLILRTFVICFDSINAHEYW